MPVIFHQETKQFHLFNRKMSYILGIMENGQVENLYFGKAIHALYQTGVSGVRDRRL